MKNKLIDLMAHYSDLNDIKRLVLLKDFLPIQKGEVNTIFSKNKDFNNDLINLINTYKQENNEDITIVIVDESTKIEDFYSAECIRKYIELKKYENFEFNKEPKTLLFIVEVNVSGYFEDCSRVAYKIDDYFWNLSLIKCNKSFVEKQFKIICKDSGIEE